MCQASGTSRKNGSSSSKGKENVQHEAKVATTHLGKKRVQAVHVISQANAETQVRTRSRTKKLCPNPLPFSTSPVAAAITKPHIPQHPVAKPVTQQKFAAEPVSTAGCQQQTGHDLPPTFSPARDNFFPEDEPGSEFGTCCKAYFCLLLYIP